MPGVTSHPFEEVRLARSLDQLIKDGETLLLNGGFATRCCAEALGCRNVRIVTNSLDLPFELVTGADVYVLGGKCRNNSIEPGQQLPWPERNPRAERQFSFLRYLYSVIQEVSFLNFGGNYP